MFAAAKHGRHPGKQLAQRKGLGDVVVGAQLQPDHLVDLTFLCRQHDDRDIALLAEDATNLEAVQLGEHEVQQDQVRARAAGLGHAVGAVLGDGHRVSLFLEVEAERISNGGVILDDKDALGH